MDHGRWNLSVNTVHNLGNDSNTNSGKLKMVDGFDGLGRGEDRNDGFLFIVTKEI